jgi:hypothetical protein
MKMKLATYLFTVTLFGLLFVKQTQLVHAAENPLRTLNNKVGIHILFDNELPEAAKLVNSTGGDWGYVVIPIQAGDKDLIKWQKFMDTAAQNHVIPIIRLATEGDYFNTKVWRKPNYLDIIDFANFLDSLNWPTKNRYIIVFNEVNRGDEWGGSTNPQEYAQLLHYAVSVFKSKTQDFYMIGAGMDNAAPDAAPDYMNEYTYFRAMQDAVPGIFNQMDGFASHSYPNPGFSQPPEVKTSKSIASFAFERDLIRTFRNSDIPVFITETGWNSPSISDETKAQYYHDAFDTVWSDPGIVMIAPFLLRAGGGPFQGFSFFAENGSPTKQYDMLKNLYKVRGVPAAPPQVLGSTNSNSGSFPLRNFTQTIKQPVKNISIVDTAQNAFKWILKL